MLDLLWRFARPTSVARPISHDVTVVGEVCDVLVMYAGRVVEDLPARELAHEARHPYTPRLSPP